MIIIPNNARLIVALDFSTVEEAKTMVQTLGDTVVFYKVGLELFSTKESFNFIEWLIAQKKYVFLDLKMYDIPETVYRAVKIHNELGVTFTSIHGCDTDCIEAAVKAANSVGVLAVTILTSKTNAGEQCLVEHYARTAEDLGACGAIMSGLDARDTRLSCSDDFLIVCPGIRNNDQTHDQKRTTTVEFTIMNGAHYLVVGRPITRAAKPDYIAIMIQREINTILNTGYNIAG